MASSYIESFPNDIVTTLLFPKTMHIIILMEVDEEQYWYLLNENETKKMPSKVTSHITLVDIHKCGHMLSSTLNHLLTLRSLNSEWQKLVDNILEWSTFQLTSEDTQKYGTNLWEFQSTFTMWCFQKKLKIFSKHSQITNFSNLGDLHITNLETLCGIITFTLMTFYEKNSHFKNEI
jgi:hypothetical protein